MKGFNMNIIYYAASSKNIPINKIGGAEMGAQKTYDFLIENGCKVLRVPKCTLYYGKLKFLADMFKTFLLIRKEFKFFKKKEEKIVFYITSFYKKQAYIEEKLISLAKKYKAKIIYEPKNGTFIQRYNNGSKTYKKIINRTLKKVDCCFCQGVEYVNFFENNFSNIKCEYIPNTVNEVSRIAADSIKEEIRLIYFGRLAEQKNILLMLEIVSDIQKYKNANLTLIGSASEPYMKVIIEKIMQLRLKDKVKIYPRSNFEKIKELCKGCHYFIFPSNEEEEGHSNSLTEAMAFGLVPIASPKGFNKSIVDNDDLIVDGYKSEDYVNRIIKLSNNFANLSKYCIERVNSNYITSNIKNKQISAIKNIY